MIKIRYISIFDVVDWSPDIILHVFWAERSSLIRIVAQRKDKWRYAFKYFVSGYVPFHHKQLRYRITELSHI